MNNSFTKTYTPADAVETRLHFPHPVVNKTIGRSNGQIRAENEFYMNRPLVNPKTGGRR